MADTPIARLSIRVFPDTTRFASELRAKLSKIGDFKVKVNPELGRFRERIEAQLSRPFEAKVDLDRGFTPRVTRSMERAFTRAEADVRDAQRRVDAWLAANPAKVRVDVDRDSLRRVGSKIQSGITGLAGGAFRFTGSVVKIGAIGVAASTAAAGIGAMTAQAVPLAAALSQAAGVAPLIPAALAGGAAVLATMAVGAKGVVDAFKLRLPSRLCAGTHPVRPARLLADPVYRV